MDAIEAVPACEFWTTNLAETQALGVSKDPDVAAAFNCTVSIARMQVSDPDGPKNYDIRVSRWLTHRDEDTFELVTTENPVYIEIIAEIERRSAR